MRDLTASLSNQLAGRFVRPAYLVKLYYSQVAFFRWCTGDTSIDWAGDVAAYDAQGLDIKNLGWDINSAGKITITVQNVDNIIGQILLANDIAGLPVKVWMMYLYDRNLVYSAVSHAAGATTLAVTEAIPKDIPSSGTIYLSSTESVVYSAVNGRVFTCAALPRAVLANEPIYIVRSGQYSVNDAIQVFDGIIDDADLNDTACVINCVPGSFMAQYTPRRRINKDNGFNVLPQTGLQVNWGGETYILEKAEY